MKILRIDPKNPKKHMMLLAADAVKEDKIIVYPTDTVYGIGCSLKPDAVKRIFEIKKRCLKQPLSIACSSMDMAADYAVFTPEESRFIKSNILKPYTFIAIKKESVPDIVTSGRDTVGIRIPNHRVVKEIIETAGMPIITSSANISGGAPPVSFQDICDEIMAASDMAVDSGRCRVGKPSRVVDLRSKRILRESR